MFKKYKFIFFCALLLFTLVVLLNVSTEFIGSVYQVRLFSFPIDSLSGAFIKLILIYVVIVGICIGSFANVVIYRLPRNIPFVNDYSCCTNCKTKIKPYDLIPIISYLFLGGRCRYCKAPISIQYPLVEFIAAVLAIASVIIYGFSAAAVTCFSLFAILLCIAFIDAQFMIIPDELVLSFAALTILHVVFSSDAIDISLQSRFVGFLALSLPMFILTLFINDAFGGGDIKLIAVTGFLLGISFTLLAGFIAILLGGIRGVYIRYIKKNVAQLHISFGQYICIGTFIAILFGKEIIGWYLSLW